MDLNVCHNSFLDVTAHQFHLILPYWQRGKQSGSSMSSFVLPLGFFCLVTPFTGYMCQCSMQDYTDVESNERIIIKYFRLIISCSNS